MAPVQTTVTVTTTAIPSLRTVNHTVGDVSPFVTLPWVAEQLLPPPPNAVAGLFDLMSFTPSPVQPTAVVVMLPAEAVPATATPPAAPSVAGPLATAQLVASPPASGLVTSPSGSQPGVGVLSPEPLANPPPPATHWLPSPSLDEDDDSDGSQW